MSLRAEAETKSSGALKYGRDVELFFNEKQYCQKLQLLPWVSLIFFNSEPDANDRNFYR